MFLFRSVFRTIACRWKIVLHFQMHDSDKENKRTERDNRNW